MIRQFFIREFRIFAADIKSLLSDIFNPFKD